MVWDFRVAEANVFNQPLINTALVWLLRIGMA